MLFEIFSLFLHIHIKDSCHKYTTVKKLQGRVQKNQKNVSFVKGELKKFWCCGSENKFSLIPLRNRKVNEGIIFLLSLTDTISLFLITSFSNEWIGFSELKSHGSLICPRHRNSEAYQWSESARCESSYLLYSLIRNVEIKVS